MLFSNSHKYLLGLDRDKGERCTVAEGPRPHLGAHAISVVVVVVVPRTPRVPAGAGVGGSSPEVPRSPPSGALASLSAKSGREEMGDGSAFRIK